MALTAKNPPANARDAGDPGSIQVRPYGTVANQAPLSMGFSRQEYWSGLPCPPPGDLPDPGIESTSLISPALIGRFFTTSAAWEAYIYIYIHTHIYVYIYFFQP